VTSPVRLVLLVVLWLLAWGEVSAANLISGVLVGIVLLVAFPPVRRRVSPLRLRPISAGRLLFHLLRELVVSNVLVAREIISRRSRVQTGVLAYPVQHRSEDVLSLLANLIALTPGTMTVEATREPPVIYVHFLLLRDIEGARRSVARLEELIAGVVRMPPAATRSEGSNV
jgi:multicomponent Na+:H+ antiporter subunit E